MLTPSDRPTAEGRTRARLPYVDLVTVLASGDTSREKVLRELQTFVTDDYELLVGHRSMDGREISQESLHAQYLHLTDRLVNMTTDGGFDRLIFLDKSARPVAVLMRLAWPVLAPAVAHAGAGPLPRLPDCTYLNIDRLQWRELMDPQGVGRFDASALPKGPITGLRDAFRPSQRSDATWLDGQRVLVVDEVRVSGDTAAIATKLLSRAFPRATFEATQWMTPKLVVKSGGNRYNNQLPVWYRDDTMLGRGIGDRDPAWSSEHANARIRSGAWFFSRPLAAPDQASVRLRIELRSLVGSLLRGEVLFVPDFDRDDLEERCRLFNGIELGDLRQARSDRGIQLDV